MVGRASSSSQVSGGACSENWVGWRCHGGVVEVAIRGLTHVSSIANLLLNSTL